MSKNFRWAAFAIALLAAPGAAPGQAVAAASYQCRIENHVKVSAEGVKTLAPHSFRVQVTRDKFVFSNVPVLTDNTHEIPLNFGKNGFFAGRSTWGDVQLNANTGTIVIYVSRLDTGYLFWGRCKVG